MSLYENGFGVTIRSSQYAPSLRKPSSEKVAYFQVSKLRELLATLLEPTCEGLDLRMDDLMCAHISALRKFLSAVLA